MPSCRVVTAQRVTAREQRRLGLGRDTLEGQRANPATNGMDTHGHSGELRVANMVARRVQHIPAATHIKVERQRDEQARTRQCRGPALDVLRVPVRTSLRCS